MKKSNVINTKGKGSKGADVSVVRQASTTKRLIAKALDPEQQELVHRAATALDTRDRTRNEYQQISQLGDDGLIQGFERKKAVLAEAKQAMDEAEESVRLMRGDYLAVAKRTAQRASSTPEAAPVPASGTSDPLPASAARPFSMTRKGLVNTHHHQWPTIDQDIKHANRNGLHVAKNGKRGWNESTALEWARSKGKLKASAETSDTLTRTMTRMADLPSRRHSIDD